MYLCEEYLQRHGILIPYVKHVSSGHVFFKYKEKEIWHLLSIKWVEPTWRPGCYYIKVFRPIHDGYKNGLLYEEILENKIFLDEYEDYFVKWKEDIGKISSQKELRMTAWEICLYCYDNLLANYVSKQDFFSTVDPTLPMEIRLQSLDKLLLYFKDRLPLFVETLNMDLIRYARGYSDWLVELVHAKNS
jgi:hypothetical protein